MALGKPQEVGAALPAFLPPRDVRVVEIAPVEAHHLYACHHGVGDGIGHGRIEKVVLEEIQHLLNRIAHRHREFLIDNRRDDGLVVPPHHGPVLWDVGCLTPHVIHEPQLVMSIDTTPKVHGPDFIEVDGTTRRTDFIHIHGSATTQTEQGDMVRSCLEAVS